MKNIIYSIGMAMLVMIGACGKDDLGREFDLSDTLQPYIIIGKTAVKSRPDSIATVRFTVRTGMSQPVTITYNVTGAVNLTNQTVVLDKFTTLKTVPISIPAGTPAPSTAEVTLVSATKSDGTQLTVGRYADPTGEKVTINIAAP